VEVRIKIKSIVTMCDEPDVIGAARDGNEEQNEPEVIRYTAVGSFTEEDGKVVIAYSEPEEFGLEGAVTALVFEPSVRDVLTMARSGEASAAFRFDMNNRRQKCIYNTPFFAAELTVITKKVANTIKNGSGAILLDYIIEINGHETEHNRTLIEVRPI
jgi:uncharacterized beta-barrel protein YwiB (DUF1934 family)